MSAPLAATGKKICTTCGQDVTGAPRMKDEHGQYYCVPCGEQNQLKQLHIQGGICEGCGESFSKSQFMVIGGKQLCPSCRKNKYRDTTGARNARKHFMSSIMSLFGK